MIGKVDADMLYFLLALLLLIVIVSLYYGYQKSSDPQWLLRGIFYVIAVLFFTYISKVILVHKPIFVLHLALVILSWIGLFGYLFKSRLNHWMLFAPLVSTLFFFAMALFFREHA